METTARSLAKAISYRFLGSASTALIFFVFTSNVKMSLGAGAVDTVVKLVAYFAHERLWEHIGFGRPKPPEYEI